MNWFQSIFGRSDEAEQLYTRNKELIERNERLEKALDIQKSANKSIADRCISLENKLELLTQDAEQYIEIETERRKMELEEQYKDQMNHRWYNAGRQDAYREMGTRALEARKAGTTMYYIKDTGEVIEDITSGLEDVPVEFTDGKENVIADEIEIGDLV